MDEFAAPLGITSSYLGFVERGTRNPSRELLQKISEIANVDYSWLRYGDPAEEAESGPQDDNATSNNNVAVDLAASLHPQLYLSIIMQRAPTVTRDILATFLLTTPETVDRILAGEPVSYDPRWGMSYSVLAQNTDITALRRDLQNIDDFLAQEEARLLVINLHRALFEYAAEKMGCEVELCPDDPDYANPSDNNLYLRSKADHKKIWYFKCFFNMAALDEDSIKWIVDNANGASLVFVHDAAYDSVYTYLEDRQAERDALDNLDSVCPPQIPIVSLISYDKESRKIDEKLYFAEQYGIEQFPGASVTPGKKRQVL